MLVNLKGHDVEYNILHYVCHHQTMIWTPEKDITSVTMPGTHIDGTVRHFGLNSPPNGKYYVCEWVQSTEMNDKLQSAKPTASVKLCCCDERWKWLNLARIVLLVCFLIDASQFAFLSARSHRPCTDMTTVVIWGLFCMFGLWGHNDEGGSGLHHHYWHGTLAWVRGRLFQRTEVCVACHWGGKSTPSVSQTRVKLVVPGKSAYSVVLEETSFPALHGTLVKVGGHHSKNWGMWSTSQTSNYTHIHTHTQLHNNYHAALRQEGCHFG